MSVHFRKITWLAVLIIALTLLVSCDGGLPGLPVEPTGDLPTGTPAEPPVETPSETLTEPPGEVPTETPAEPPEGGATATEQDPDLAYTQAAQTIVAELTLNAPPTETPSLEEPTPTFPPTSTPLPTNTPLPTDTTIPTNTLQPEGTPVSDETETSDDLDWDLVYEDNFDYRMGWVEKDHDVYKFTYGMGGYFMRNKSTNVIVWSVRIQPQVDVRVEATAQRRKTGPRNGYYGVTCRHENGFYYYALVVGTDGTYGIGKVFGGLIEFIEKEQDTQNRVYTGNGINEIRGDCVGPNLTLYANGHKLMEVRDTTFTAGSVGMVVGTSWKPYMDVIFSRFALYELAE